MKGIVNNNKPLGLPDGYDIWRKEIISLIETAKYNAALNVNAELLALYWKIGSDIIKKQQARRWGAQVIVQLSKDLTEQFAEDKGYSERNLRNMKRFAAEYPDFPFLQVPLAKIQNNPIWQVPLAELEEKGKEFLQVPLAQITWYHHISLLSKVKDVAERAFYIMATAHEGWSRDVMLMQIANGYIYAKGKAINNFDRALPPIQSDLARYTFKDPYNFSFLGAVALQNELSIEIELAKRVTDFLLEMGRGFSFVGRQYHLTVDEYVKSPEDKPTIGLLLCRTKSNTKARFALRGITQPLGIAQYETEKLFADVASALPQIEDLEDVLEKENEGTAE